MRHRLDAYETAAHQVEALLPHLVLAPNAAIFEPCNGTGRITQVLRAHGYQVRTADIDDQYVCDHYGDATEPDAWQRWQRTSRMDWVITNPPYVDALPIVEHALFWAQHGVAMLLRLSWLEPTRAREAFLLRRPPDRLIVLPRHSYTNNGKTDSVTSAWMVWGTVPGVVVAPRFAGCLPGPTRYPTPLLDLLDAMEAQAL